MTHHSKHTQHTRNMKTVLVFAILCITMCLGAVSLERPNPKAGKGKCLSSTYPNLGELNHGQSKQVPRQCTQLTCNNDGGIQVTSCGAVAVEKGCTVKKDLSKPYPDCCPQVKC